MRIRARMVATSTMTTTKMTMTQQTKRTKKREQQHDVTAGWRQQHFHFRQGTTALPLLPTLLLVLRCSCAVINYTPEFFFFFYFLYIYVCMWICVCVGTYLVSAPSSWQRSSNISCNTTCSKFNLKCFSLSAAGYNALQPVLLWFGRPLHPFQLLKTFSVYFSLSSVHSFYYFEVVSTRRVTPKRRVVDCRCRGNTSTFTTNTSIAVDLITKVCIISKIKASEHT